MSTIKRRLHQSKHRGDDRRILSLSQHPAKRRTLSRRQTCLQSREDFTRANTEASPQAANKTRLDFAKKYLKSQTSSGKAFFGRLKLRSTYTRMKYGKGLEQLMIKAHNIICCVVWSSVMHELHGFQWLWVTVFSDEETIIECIEIYCLPRCSQMQHS